MSGPIGFKGPTGSGSPSVDALKETMELVQELSAESVSSKDALIASQETAVNPFAAKYQKNVKDLKSQGARVNKMLKSGEKSERLLPIQLLKDTADEFQRKNPELRSDMLLRLRDLIKPGDTKEDILRKLAELYPDVSLADEALDFLLETTEGELAQTVQEAKTEFNQEHAREIKAGKNISSEARAAAEKGLGTATSMRDMYREITGNPRDSTTLFKELSNKYAFKDLKKIIDFMLHSLGSDLKSSGPSIARGLLHRLITETRNMQAILGVYRFFRGRMHLVETMFAEQQMGVPKELSFETMAKQFMTLAAERYPTADKVLQLAKRLGISASLLAKIIVLSQMRDAVREVARDLIFKSLQHRDELYLAILEALEDLEEELEEISDEEEEKKRKKDEEEDEEEKDDGKQNGSDKGIDTIE